MIDADYQVAVLLQQQIEQENAHSNDFNFALTLQHQFEREIHEDGPTNSIVYDTNKLRSKSDTRSLVDPSWELVDPTPNVHTLFVAFNERFFWGKLVAVCVSWSKRMTSCAGICSYQGRGGMCSITLSEPLLKLRPRKDLVETLLHEMIHAYLFVTHNNRDRDGHGPEFHKHMYRINKESGTNITVYHSFHDEVLLYQQHWWRCNGPCQQRKPYFGIVRRATNRAPGPYDRWWDEHFRNCGGNFIKIKEPENKKISQAANNNKTGNSQGDIRNFVSVVKHVENDKNICNVQKPNNTLGLDRLSNVTQSSAKTGAVFASGNIHGFSSSTGLSSSSGKHTGSVGATGMKSNSSSTVVINKKPSTLTKTEVANNKTKLGNTSSFSGTGQTLHPNTTTPSKNNDYTTVRNHWLNKFRNNENTSSTKRPLNNIASEGYDKFKKPKKILSPLYIKGVECPVCCNHMESSALNNHLDKCLALQANTNEQGDSETCFICGKKMPALQLASHVSNCFDNNFSDDDAMAMTRCEICNTSVQRTEREEHTKACLEKIFHASSQKSNNSLDGFGSTEIVKASLTQCSVCDEMVESSVVDRHKEACLHKMFDAIESRCDIKKTDVLVPCLVCNRTVLRSELNTHLDDCMNGVFDERNEFDQLRTREISRHSGNGDLKEKTGDADAERRYNCPFCLELYSELDMSGHIDRCLDVDEDGKCKIDEKSVLIDSLSSDNFY